MNANVQPDITTHLMVAMHKTVINEILHVQSVRRVPMMIALDVILDISFSHRQLPQIHVVHHAQTTTWKMDQCALSDFHHVKRAQAQIKRIEHHVWIPTLHLGVLVNAPALQATLTVIPTIASLVFSVIQLV